MKNIIIVDDDGNVRGSSGLIPMYIHTDKDGDTFITDEGASGLEHFSGRCDPHCEPTLEIIVQGDFS